MSLLRNITSGLRSLFQKEQVDRELDEELRAYQDMAAEEKMKDGMTRREALRAVRLERGSLEVSKEIVRSGGWESLVETCWQDLRFAARTLRKSSGFTTVAVLTLALGIGANTAMFSVVEGVLLAPLPYSHPDRLVVVWENNLHFKQVVWPSYPNFKDWQRSARSFERMAAVKWRYYDLTSPSSPEHLLGAGISFSFLDTLDVKLPFGRDFSAQEDQRGGAPLVIISSDLWRNRFASNPQAVGKAVTLSGVDYTIIGILPPRFHFGDERVDVYTPLAQGQPSPARPARRARNCIHRAARNRFRVDVGAALSNDFAWSFRGIGPAFGVGRNLRRDFLFGDAACTGDWDSHGAWCREAEYLSNGNRTGLAAGVSWPRDWDRGCARSHPPTRDLRKVALRS